jgi:hypothetical protein
METWTASLTLVRWRVPRVPRTAHRHTITAFFMGLVHQDGAPFRFRYAARAVERRRHVRKYAEGDLGEDKSFWFGGPDGALSLRAQNLSLFLQIGEGVDHATWLHHLRRGDYAGWFREAIKDEALAADVEDIQRHHADDPAESRARLRRAIERRYTTPV